MRMIKTTLLAGALVLALPMGSAMACTVSAWANSAGGTTATNANAGGPTNGIARYSGACALSVTDKVVVDNTPSNEGVYRARFYVRPGSVSGSGATIFKAAANDNGAGNGVIAVAFNGSKFSFTENGNSAGEVSGIQAGKWYSIEVAYKKNTSFSATVWGAGSTVALGSSSKTSGVGAGEINSAVLGVSAGATSAFNFDAFESTRSESTPIGRLCRGDTNGDAVRDIVDVGAIVNEILSGNLSSGQPDANEDGDVDIIDAGSVVNWVLAGTDSCS